MDFDELFKFLNIVNRQAGAIVRRYFGRQIEVTRKADLTPVTDADREVERFLRAAIERQYPNHSILGEELGETSKGGGFRWVIDPIDGTKTFLLRTPLFGILLALENNGVPILGSIYLPIQDQLMIGSKETGTFLNGVACSVSRVSRMGEARLMITDPSCLTGLNRDPGIERLIESVELTRGFGDCYGYFLVASGAADIMVDPILAYHDLAALIPIIEGAGGRLTSRDGQDALTAKSAVATNGLLHDEVVRVLSTEC
jgi:histidinol-phosphatase